MARRHGDTGRRAHAVSRAPRGPTNQQPHETNERSQLRTGTQLDSLLKSVSEPGTPGGPPGHLDDDANSQLQNPDDIMEIFVLFPTTLLSGSVLFVMMSVFLNNK